MISYWEQTELLHADVTIVGAGITGLSIAASLLERDANLKIRILERSILPFGASTRNAGFACFGSPTEFASDIALMGEEAARELVFQRWMGIQITRKRLTDASIGYINSGGYELISEATLDELDLDRLNALLADFLPQYFKDDTKSKAALGLKAEGRLLHINGEGQVNSGKLMRALSAYVSSLGAECINGTWVEALSKQNGLHYIHIKDRLRGNLALSSDELIVANNAFATELLGIDAIKPGRGQVLITAPIKGLNFRGNLHIEEGFYYLRDIGNRLMFGGGRNLDMEVESTHEQGINESIQSALDDYLKRLFGNELPIQIEQRWSGTMAFTQNKQPIVQQNDSGVWLVAGLSGMGIALAGFLGEELADRWKGMERLGTVS